MSMWMATPAYFAVVLVKTLWIGGDYNMDGHEIASPVASVVAKIEPSLKTCQEDGKKWELSGEVSLLQNQAQDLQINNGAWKCVVVATGGLETKYQGE